LFVNYPLFFAEPFVKTKRWLFQGKKEGPYLKQHGPSPETLLVGDVFDDAL